MLARCSTCADSGTKSETGETNGAGRRRRAEWRGGDDAGTDVPGKLAPPFERWTRPGKPERRELAAVNPHADVAVSYDDLDAISPAAALHPGVGANT